MLLQLNEVPYKRRRKLEVVELRDIEKDYALIHACLQLAQKSNQRSSHVAAMSRTMSASRRADEVVVLLVDAGLFDVAVDICRLFDIKMDVVFEHLAVRCKHPALQSVYISRQKLVSLCAQNVFCHFKFVSHADSVFSVCLSAA